MKKTPVVVLDLETTGLSPYRHNITEIAAVKVLDGRVIDEFQTLVNPQEKIPSFITSLTGITDEMVAQAPCIDEVLDDLEVFLGDHTLIGHNITFDRNFLAYAFRNVKNFTLSNPTLCTCKLSRRIHSDLSSHKLGSLCEFYGIVNEAQHRAMGDVRATVALLAQLQNHLQKANIISLQDVAAFEKLSLVRAQRRLHRF